MVDHNLQSHTWPEEEVGWGGWVGVPLKVLVHTPTSDTPPPPHHAITITTTTTTKLRPPLNLTLRPCMYNPISLYDDNLYS